MRKKEFIEKHKSDSQGYCPCVVDAKGDVYECPKGHLQTLMELAGNGDMLEKIPNNVSPLFYMIIQTKAVVVDYENQVYSEEINQEQWNTLLDLSENGLIQFDLKNIHKNIEL